MKRNHHFGLERRDGFDVGRDPRAMSADELAQLGPRPRVAVARPSPQMPRLLQRLCAGGAALHSGRLPQLAVPDGQEPVAVTVEC